MVLRIVPTVVLVLALLAPSEGIAASQEEKPFKPLTELSEVSIVVEGLSSETRRVGLSVESLESQALVAIRRDIPSLTVTNDAIPYLYINVLVIQTETVGGREIGFVSFVKVQLKRPARIQSDDWGRELGFHMAGVWTTGGLLVGTRQSIAGQVMGEIDRNLKQFAADYYRHNP